MIGLVLGRLLIVHFVPLLSLYGDQVSKMAAVNQDSSNFKTYNLDELLLESNKMEKEIIPIINTIQPFISRVVFLLICLLNY